MVTTTTWWSDIGGLIGLAILVVMQAHGGAVCASEFEEMPAMAINVRVVRVALRVDDAEHDVDDALADDVLREATIGSPKQLRPVVERVVSHVLGGHAVGDALRAQSALPPAGSLATHAWCKANVLEVFPPQASWEFTCAGVLPPMAS